MSYILDALRKADAQRAGNPARGIHAQPVGVSGTATRPAVRLRQAVLIAGLLAVLLTGSALWYLTRADRAVVAIVSRPPGPAVVQAPVIVLPPPPAAPPAATRLAASRPVAAPSTVPVASTVVAAEPAPVSGGLPADAPRLAISGGVYSESPAQRLLIVNGVVFNEGAEVSPGVLLEQIRPKAAILRYRGARYLLAY